MIENMENLMIDLETLGNNFITQMGACFFDWDGSIGKTHLANISLAESIQRGSKIDVSNLKFWFENSDKISWLKNGISLTKAIQEFTVFYKQNKKALVWSHYYDIMVIENVSKLLGQKIPFPFRNWRDIRTLVSLSDYHTKKEKGIDPKTHNALDDCLFQVKYCCEAYKKLKKS